MRETKPEELIELFKHWDTRASHQELLYIPIALAAFPAVAATWDKIGLSLVVVVAVASQFTYWFFVLSSRRFTIFQDNIDRLLSENHLSDWHSVISDHRGRIGIRKLRSVGLFVLGLLWIAVVATKDNETRGTAIPLAIWLIWALVLFSLTAWHYLDAPATTRKSN